MNWRACLGSFLIAICLCGTGASSDRWKALWGVGRVCETHQPSSPPLPVRFTHPTYCPKKLPHAFGVKHFGCDDYYPKILPCLFPVPRFGCDDYCRKKLPSILFTPPPTLRCFPWKWPCQSDCHGR